MNGPRPGDIGTAIVLHVNDRGEPVDLSGAAATIEIGRPRADVQAYDAVVDGQTVSYTGKPTDDLWPTAGVYTVRAVIRWTDGRRFASQGVQITVS